MRADTRGPASLETDEGLENGGAAMQILGSVLAENGRAAGA